MVHFRNPKSIAHLWYFISSILFLFFIIITYHTLLSGDVIRLSPTIWKYIDKTYIFICWIVWIGMVSNIISFFFHEIKHIFFLEHAAIKKFLPLINVLMLMAVWGIWLSFALEAIGINTGNLLTGAGIWWLMFVFAGRDIIANLFGSFMMIMSKKFEIGDLIHVKGIEGIVEEVTLDHTKIMGNDGKVVYIPNKIIIMEQLENLTRRRFFTYNYQIPFKKDGRSAKSIRDALMMIDGKISTQTPISVTVRSENTNASDFVYFYTIALPEENAEFDREMQNFLIDFIFPKKTEELAK